MEGREPEAKTRATEAIRLAAVEAELAATRDALHDAHIALAEAQSQLNASREDEAQSLREVQHRVRNMLAVVRSIFARTAETRDSVEEVASHFRGRLDAFARYVAEALDPKRQILLEDIVHDELLQFGADGDPRIRVDGPDVTLTGGRGEAFSLAIHELVSNSVKYGVLSPDMERGSIEILWSLADGAVRFRWIETGMAVIGPVPMRYGFGREFIEQSLPYQQDASTTFDLAPGRLTCIILLPLTEPDPNQGDTAKRRLDT